MKLKHIQDTISARPAHMPGLSTWRAFSQPGLDHLDPFLLLNHHGPEHFQPNNSGLPFGPHPHRGFETLTFIISGDVAHRDSTGTESVIREGGIQWMTAGSGIVHEEVSSAQFLKDGGEEEVLQLWMNLPAKLKMTAPAYSGLQHEQIPQIELSGKQATLELISGEWEGVKGPIHSVTGLFTSVLKLRKGQEVELFVEAERTVLFYLVKGEVVLNGTPLNIRQFPLLDKEEGLLKVSVSEDATILFCHGAPINEAIVSYGPFVMNTEQEIDDAIRDYQSGKFGGIAVG